MARQLKVQPQQEEDLSAISGIGEAELRNVLMALRDVPTPILAASELRSLIRDKLDTKEASSQLARQLIALESFSIVSNSEPRETIESLLKGIKSSQLDSGKKEKLNNISKILVELLENKSVYLTAKALHLGFNSSTIYTSGEILTDIRPVFDREREDIVGSVIVQTLRVSYLHGGRKEEISLAMDRDDLKALVEQLNRAVSKAEKAKALMAEKKGLRAFIVGEETYGFE